MKRLLALFLTISALAAHGGVTGQLWYGTGYSSTNTLLGHVNSDGSSVTIAFFQPDLNGVIAPVFDMAVDSAAGFYWVVDPDTLTITEYKVSNNSQVGSPLQIGDVSDEDVVDDMVVDPLNHVLYVEEWGASLAETGIEKITYNPTSGAMGAAGTFLVSGATAGGTACNAIGYMSLDLADQLLYYVANDNGYDVSPWEPVNGVFVYNIAGGGNPVQLSSSANVTGGFPPGDVPGGGGGTSTTDDPNGMLGALAVDVADHLVYFLTCQFTNGGTNISQDALWYVTTTGGANQIATKVTLPAGTAIDFPGEDGGLSFDPINRQLYISDQPQGFPNPSRILVGQLSANGHSITSFTTNTIAKLTGIASPDQYVVPIGSTFLVLPEPVLASSASYTAGASATTLSPSMTISNPTGGYLIGATVAITGGLLSGDTLAATVTGTSISPSYISGTGVLTLTGYDTPVHYQQVLRSVNYVTTNSNPDNSGADTSRTVTWTLYDGEPNIPAGSSNSASTTIQVNQAPGVTSANNATFVVGSNGSFTVTATGYPTPTLSVSNTDVFPSGVTFTPGTGKLSGTPAAGTGGTYTLHFSAANAAGTNTQTFTLTVDQPPAITSASGTTFITGVASNFTVTASGFPTPTFSESGALPNGLVFTNNTGKLGGTAVAGTGGTYSITFTATNVLGTNTQAFTLTVLSPAEVGCPENIVSNAAAGYCPSSPISFSATGSGYPSPTVTYTLDSGLITSPYAFPVGTNTVTCIAVNSTGTNSCSFTVTVNPGPLPQLTAVQLGTNIVITWPSSYTCYSLQIASDLSGGGWTDYTGALVTNGGSIFVTNNPSVTSGFFRLKD